MTPDSSEERATPEQAPPPPGVTARGPGFKTQQNPPPSPSRQPSQPPPPPPSDPPRRPSLLGRLRGAGAPEPGGRPMLTTGSSIPGSTKRTATADSRAIARVIYVLLRGGTKLADRFVARWRPTLHVETTAQEARDMARPLARYAARRMTFDGDPSDTVDGLAFMFALAGYAARVAGIDPDHVESSDDFDPKLLDAIHAEVVDATEAERVRRATAGV